MKRLATILLFFGVMFASLIASLVITWVAWQVQISEKAFHCTDDNVSGLWGDMDIHRSAGDTLLSGWTWEELKLVRLIYEVIFYTLWIGGGLLVFRVLRRFFDLGPPSSLEKLLHLTPGGASVSNPHPSPGVAEL